jgi:hypothetical protein
MEKHKMESHTTVAAKEASTRKKKKKKEWDISLQAGWGFFAQMEGY